MESIDLSYEIHRIQDLRISLKLEPLLANLAQLELCCITEGSWYRRVYDGKIESFYAQNCVVTCKMTFGNGPWPELAAETCTEIL